MMRRLALASALFVAVGSAAPSMAVAGNTSTTFQISASVPSSCTISTTALNFGTYDRVIGSNVTATVTTNCSVNASAQIMLGQGLNSDTASSNDSPLRRLKNENGGTINYLSYTLYQNSGKTTIWGNSTNTGVNVVGNGNNQVSSVYGAITAGQSLPAGTYTDTVVANITF